MQNAKVAVFCAATLASFAISGCSSSSGGDPSPSSGAVKTVTVSKSTPSWVEGKDYSVLTHHPALLHGELTIFLARTKSSYVMSTGGTEKTEDPRGETLDLVDKVSGDVRVLARHGSPGVPRFIVDALVTGNTVVWVETTQANLESMPWEMYSLDLSGGKEKHIASHETFGIKNPPWTSDTGLRPQVIDGVVYFVAVDSVNLKKRIRHRSVYRVPIAGGADPELVAPGASEVYVDGKNLLVQLDGQLVGWDPAEGKHGEIATTNLPATCGAFVNEGVRVTCSGEAKNLHVDSPAYGKFLIDVGHKGTGYYNATSRWVSFSTSDQAYVLDLKRGRLMAIPGAEGTSTARYTGNTIEYAKISKSATPLPVVALLPR